MKISEAVMKRLFDLLTQKHLSLYQFSKLSCIPLSTLKNMLNGHTKSPTLNLIYIICDALEISVIEFLDCDYLKDTEIEFDT